MAALHLPGTVLIYHSTEDLETNPIPIKAGTTRQLTKIIPTSRAPLPFFPTLPINQRLSGMQGTGESGFQSQAAMLSLYSSSILEI